MLNCFLEREGWGKDNGIGSKESFRKRYVGQGVKVWKAGGEGGAEFSVGGVAKVLGFHILVPCLLFCILLVNIRI